jgi:hypothetical protein
MSEQAFVGAGKKAGLELWRIEALKPVAQPTVSSWISVDLLMPFCTLLLICFEILLLMIMMIG